MTRVDWAIDITGKGTDYLVSKDGADYLIVYPGEDPNPSVFRIGDRTEGSSFWLRLVKRYSKKAALVTDCRKLMTLNVHISR